MTTVADDNQPRDRFEAIEVKARGGKITWYVFDRQTRVAGEGTTDEWRAKRLVRDLNDEDERARQEATKPKSRRPRRPKKGE